LQSSKWSPEPTQINGADSEKPNEEENLK